jgi:hypothetical protein
LTRPDGIEGEQGAGLLAGRIPYFKVRGCRSVGISFIPPLDTRHPAHCLVMHALRLLEWEGQWLSNPKYFLSVFSKVQKCCKSERERFNAGMKEADRSGGIHAPMDEPIMVSFCWTAKEMLLAQRLHMRYSKSGRKLRRFFLGCAILFVIGGIGGFARQPHDFLTSALPLFVMAAFFFAMPLFTRRAVLKMYAQKPDRDMPVTYEISPDRIATKSEVASSDIVWRAILRAYRVPHGFLLYPSDRMFYWLPIDGFGSAAEVERFASLAKSKAQQYEDAT